MNSKKAPGPDGFFMAFFQVCLEVIKADLMRVLHNFHASRKFEKSLNATSLPSFQRKFCF
jgi:hypothetical protein